MRKILVCVVLALVASGITAADEKKPVVFPPDEVTIPAKTVIPVVLVNPLDARTAKSGTGVIFRTAGPIQVSDRWAIPGSLVVEGVILRVERAGRLYGRSEIKIYITTLYLPNDDPLSLFIDAVEPLGGVAEKLWYQTFETPKVSGGSLILRGKGRAKEDAENILAGGILTIPRRGPDISVFAGTPFLLVLSSDVKISLRNIPLLAIEQLCPCPDTPRETGQERKE